MTGPILTNYQNGVGNISGPQANSFVQNAQNVAQLRAFVGVTPLVVFLEGYVTPGDNGQGNFYWNASAVNPVDDGGVTTIVPPAAASGCWSRISVLGTISTLTPGSYTNTNITVSPQGQITQISNGVINEGFNNFIETPYFENIPSPPTASLTQIFAAGTAVYNNMPMVVPAYTLTMPTNSITRIWFTGVISAPFQIDTVASNNYVNLPRYPNYLPLWECQSNGATINDIKQMGNDFETVVRRTDYARVTAQISELYGISITSTPTAWTNGGSATFRTIYVNSKGYLYQCFFPGIFGSSEPTGTHLVNGVLQQFQNGGATLAYYGQFNFVGNMRYGINNQIENYFSNIGVTNFTNLVDANGVQQSVYCKAYWQSQITNLILNRVNSGTYLFGMKMIAGGYIWLNQTFGTAGSGGTTAGSSPFSGVYTPGVSMVTDGSITWLCIYTSYASQYAFWMDTIGDPTMLNYSAPDSHDSYASTPFIGLNTYIQQTNDWQWLLGNSPQPSGSGTYFTYLQCLQDIFDANLLPLSNFLTLTFQSNINPLDGSSYSVQFMEDNTESYSAFIAAKNIFTLLGDSTRAGQANTNAADVNSGLFNLVNLTYNVMTEFFGDNPINWPISSPTLPFYPFYQMQFFPELHQIPSINDDLKQQFRAFVLSKWASFYTDKSKDVTPAAFIGYIAAIYWQDTAKAYAFIEIIERYFIANSAINIQDFGYYLQIKNWLNNNQRLSNINGPKITFQQSAGQSSFTLNQTRVFTGSGQVNIYPTDYMVGIDKASGANTAVSITFTPADGTPLIIKDMKGDAATHNITITPNAGNIDGSSTYVISSNYGAVRLRYNAANSQWYSE